MCANAWRKAWSLTCHSSVPPRLAYSDSVHPEESSRPHSRWGYTHMSYKATSEVKMKDLTCEWGRKCVAVNDKDNDCVASPPPPPHSTLPHSFGSQMVSRTKAALESVGCRAQGRFNNMDTCSRPWIGQCVSVITSLIQKTTSVYANGQP